MTAITNDVQQLTLWSNLTFKTKSYRKNFDLTTENENIITEYEGSVTELQLAERQRPNVVGEYGFSIWNIDLAKKLHIDLNALLKAYAIENTYSELKELVDNKEINLYNYQKIILIHTFIVRADYRKHGITEEFIETMYRDYYNVQDAMIVLVKPFQYNPIDNDYYRNHKFVKLLNKIGDIDDAERIPAYEYYSLIDLYNKDDVEYNEFKLFAVASRCGFNRINDNTHLFMFSPERTVERMVEKMTLAKTLNIK